MQRKKREEGMDKEEGKKYGREKEYEEGEEGKKERGEENHLLIIAAIN